MPHLVALAFVAVGGATVATWLVKEFRRINRELTNVQVRPVGEPRPGHDLPTLRRDPGSDEWRVG